ncbi:hypothetical protein QVD17_07941 [Tagetes erecta]|uniref:Protein Mpv17 n=1 Tax=Tagetes erecta TaxID=13708 RepID=A0AAD8KYF6_TARER|nr:hypothetical protein QVD17_07941 [Tagetes erecta]
MALIFSAKSPILFNPITNHTNPNFRTLNFPQIKPLGFVKNASFSPFAFQSNLKMSLNRELRVNCIDSVGGGGDGAGDGSGGGGGGGGGDGGGNKWSFLSWYLSLLEKHPVWTKAITSALLTFIGDLICQVLIDKVPSLDLKRVSLFTFLGMALVGPTLHFWYLYLSKLVTMTGSAGAFVRLLIDQFIFAPTFIAVFLSTLVTLEGRPAQVLPKLQQEWVSSVIVNWQLWIPFQFLNFRFVPQQFQVLAANFVSLIWNVILSYKAHKQVVAK